MTKEELAIQLDGRHDSIRFTDEELEIMKKYRLVVVHPYSDDGILFDGSITSHLGSFEGCIIFVNRNGVDTDYHKGMATIRQIWSGTKEYAWTYETDLPHATFDIFEHTNYGGDRGKKFAKAIIFSIDDLKELL